MLSESGIIHFLKTRFPAHIGDDAAVLPQPTHNRQVITQDLLVEDVHFRLRYQDAASLAHKALHVNLSDIAAMGATPQYVLLGLSFPKPTASYIHDFLEHFSAVCNAHHVTLIGGDTTRSPDKVFISVTAIGNSEEKNIKYRHTAKPGDVICIAGHLGEAHLGFTALEQGETGFDDLKNLFLQPHARVNEGVWLGKQAGVTAMMDVSDGLFIDLEKLAEASKIAATIQIDRLLSTPLFRLACQQLKRDPVITQLTGGEDYGLLLTVKSEVYTSLSTAFMTHFGYALQPIGHMNQGNGVHLIKHGHPIHLQLETYAHF